MASSGLELLLVSLPQLGKGAAQTLSISALGIVFATLGGVLYGVLATLGKRSVNVDPAPGDDTHSILPPWWRAILATSARPMPNPVLMLSGCRA